MLEKFIDKIKEFIKNFVSLEMIDKIIDYLQKVINILVEVKDWLFNAVNKLFGE